MGNHISDWINSPRCILEESHFNLRYVRLCDLDIPREQELCWTLCCTMQIYKICLSCNPQVQAFTKYHHCCVAFIVLGKWTWTLGSKLGLTQMLTDWWMNRLTNRWTNGQKTGSLYCVMLKAGMTKMAKLLANSGEPDQTPHSTVSDLGLHCLPIILLGDLQTKMGWNR